MSIDHHANRNAKVVKIGFLALGTMAVFITLMSNNFIKDNSYTTKKINKVSDISRPSIFGHAVLGAQSDEPNYSILINKLVKTTDDSGLQAGNVHYALNITLTNQSNHTLQVSPLLQMFLYNDKGGKYTVDASLSNDPVPLGGPLESGKSVSGTVDFAVPEKATVKKFSFQEDDISQKIDLSLEGK